MENNILLINFDDILQYTNVDGSVDPTKVMPHILNAQILYLEPIIGTDLYDKLCLMVSGNTLADPYEELLIKYITPSVVMHCMELYIPLSTYLMADGGMFKHTYQNAEGTELDLVEKMTNKYRIIGAKYDQKLADWLCKNSTSFPEYTNNDGLVKSSEVSPRSTWYLGQSGIKNNKRM